ncbi:hypothetical protein ABPG72_002809 [Tetrahymena utriculariae]
MAVNACLGSWFFGYNLGVYNSAQKIMEKLNGWDNDEFELYTALITAFMPLGALLGALFSRQILEAIKGIRKSMLIFDIIGIIGTIIIIIDHTVPNLLIGRFICGFCIGTNTAIIPIYIKDFSPIEISGRAGAVNQIILTFGVFCSYLIALVLPLPANTKDGYSDGGPWRIVLGLPMIAPVIRLIILLFIFRLETPTIMIKEHRYQEVKEFFKQIYSSEKDAEEVLHGYEEKVNEEQAEKEKLKHNMHSDDLSSNGGNKGIHINEIVNNHHEETNIRIEDQPKVASTAQNNEFNIQLATNLAETQANVVTIQKTHIKTYEDFYHEKIFQLSNKATYIKRFILGCAIQFCTQCSGVNAILFYSNSIFKDTSGKKGADAELVARQATIGLGASMVVFNMLSFYLLGKLGRRTLMITGVSIVNIALFVFAGIQKVDKSNTSVNNFGIFLIFLFQLGWQISLGAVTWILNSEILDRLGISVSSFIRWTFAMIVGLVFPYMKEDIGLFGSFLVFGGFTFVIYIYFIFTIKETKEKDRYEILKNYCNPIQYKEFEKISTEFAKQAFEDQKNALNKLTTE